MKLLFISAEVSKDLSQSLLSNGFEIEQLKKIPTKEKDGDLVAYGGTEPPTPAVVETLPKAFPTSWLVLIVKKTWLAKPEFQSILLNSPQVITRDL